MLNYIHPYAIAKAHTEGQAVSIRDQEEALMLADKYKGRMQWGTSRDWRIS